MIFFSFQKRIRIIKAKSYHYPEITKIEKKTEIVNVGGREYTIYLFESQGEKYWHCFGNVMTYERASDDVKEIKKLIVKQFPGYKLKKKN